MHKTVLALCLLPLPVLAQTTDHSGHAATGAESPAAAAFAEVNARMHEAM